MLSEKQVTDVLRKVIHPEKKKDIVSLGMVERITVGSSGISLVLTPEKSNDPFIGSLKSSIVRLVKDEFGADTVVNDIRVEPKVNVGKKQEPAREVLPGVTNIIAVSSGKGGVGKSTVAVNLSVALAAKGYTVGLLDADIYGPSVPMMFGEGDYRPDVRREGENDILVPLIKYGVRVLSIGFFVDPAEAIVWRGPMASNFLKQLITRGEWGELDFLLVDLPPGTSDIHLTLVQEVPVTGAIVVSTPQEVALADAVKGISMFRSEKINVPVLGLVENMSWFTPAELPGNRYYIFGKEGCKALSGKMDVPLLGQIPVVQSICEGGDAGHPVALDGNAAGRAFMDLADEVAEKVHIRNVTGKPTERLKIN
ncbi:MAG TPA: Mrp/NBP35 family ATP-binding protein [Bacteroidales bacterium]|nr:Mrp/NBP35 family ATP-binding protein [Bacteroidales bacterium]